MKHALWLVVILVGLLLVAWLWPFRRRVSGTWRRIDVDAPEGEAEQLSLVQLGPWVRGRRWLPGGFQEFSGYQRGRTLFLSRRDHGEAYLKAQGFPEALIPSIEGSVMATFKLTLSADATVLFGSFSPQKLEFTRHPPRVLRRHFLEAQHRRYRRAH